MKRYVLCALVCLLVVSSRASQYSGTPYSGSPVLLPGTVSADNFDNGGEGVAYHDTDSTNTTGSYRTNVGVDIELTGDTGGGNHASDEAFA